MSLGSYATAQQDTVARIVKVCILYLQFFACAHSAYYITTTVLRLTSPMFASPLLQFVCEAFSQGLHFKTSEESLGRTTN